MGTGGMDTNFCLRAPLLVTQSNHGPLLYRFRDVRRYSSKNVYHFFHTTPVTKSLTALFGMRHLTYGTIFSISLRSIVSRPPQSALLHRQALTLLLNRWSACLTGSSILVLKLIFSQDPFRRNLPLSLTD